jgi:hypothetical protein
MERSKKTEVLMKKLWASNFDESIKLETKQITIPYDTQTELFDEPERDYTKAITVYSGTCFENLAGAIFGGFHHGGKSTSMSNGAGTIQPDISDHKNRRYIEVKSRCQNMQPKFLKEQIIKNLSWMLYDFSEPRPRSYMALFSHNILGMQKRGLSRAEYLEELVKGGVLYGILMPIIIPAQFFVNPDKTEASGYMLNEYNYTPELEHRGYASCKIVSFSTRLPNDLILEPEQTLEKIGFDLKDFKISRRKVKGLRINNRQVHQFPMLLIDGKLDKWIAQNKESITKLIGAEIELPAFYEGDGLFGSQQKYAPTEKST